MSKNVSLGFLLLFAAPALAHEEGYDDGDDGDWTMFNHDVRGTRHATHETRLTPRNVNHLHKLWQIDTAGAITGTAAVTGDRVYIGDWAGNFYKLRSGDGSHVWTTPVIGPISASAMVRDDRVIFGDQVGYLYGLDRDSGAIRWQIRPNDHPQAAIFGSALPLGGSFVMGISSNEEQAAATPGYPCCSFRGSVVMVDSNSGRLIWQTYFISEAESAAGASGATVFGSPTYDEDLDLIFVATSNNYSSPATSKSDAFFALNPRNGHIVWQKQVIKNDISNFTIPWHQGIDAGISDSPQIYRLPNGRKVIGAGGKLGHYFVLDAASGELLADRRIQTSGSLGGMWESAIADGVVYAPGIDWDDPFDFVDRATGGILTAFTGDARRILWQITTPFSINQGAVAVANSVVYATSCDPGTGTRIVDDVGTLLAVDAGTGAELANVPLGHCSSSGTAIVDGKVFVGTGNMFQFATIPPGTFAALGL
jgi:polyvinyl alcohol dehydrogenase (cytochrome)